MNEEAHNVILAYFCERRCLSPKAISSGLADMICAVTAPYLLIVECLDSLDSDPSNGLLVKLVHRAYETAAGSLALIAINHLREAEILARSVYESTATTAYIAKELPSLRLAQLFRAYVKEEREQNSKWAKDAEGASPEVWQEHDERIRVKNEAMDAYEQLIDIYISHCRVDPGKATKWPSLIDRLTALDRRIEYRTVYAAMCSQAHHDAEDVLNYFLAHSIEGIKGVSERMEREADAFSIFMVLFGLRSYMEAILAVCSHLKFPTVVVEGLISLKRVTDELQVVSPLLDSGEFPQNWIAKLA